MTEELWYKNAVIYSLDVDSFMDSNGDGIGDFDGLMQRLDYLYALGIDTIWLAPFQPTPDKDNGYDVSDYYGVDPRYGSSGDFVAFMHQARKRGMRVIIDLVINHTSDQHRWYQSARSSPDSEYRDWYVWSKDRPSNWDQGMVFPGVQDATWTYDEKAEAYYFHRFYDHQPDLNMDNPKVRAEVRRIVGYWLELGIAGFRVDAVPFMIESKCCNAQQGQLHFEYLTELRKFIQWRSGSAIMLGEANVTPKDTKPYFEGGGGENGIHMMFNFWVNQHLFYALATADLKPLQQALKATRNIPQRAQWAHFLRNHDELDLGRLSEEQRQAVFERFGPEPRMQLYDRGIRRRLAPMLGDRRHIELAYSLMFSLPGTPVLRYGDEIGMGDDLSLAERRAVRTPMQWADEPQGGFSMSPDTLNPVISDGLYGYPIVNAEAQRREPDSLLNWTSRMIRLRRECPEIGNGAWSLIPTGCPEVLAMRYDWQGNTLITVHNFDDRPHEVRLSPGDTGDDRLVDLISDRFHESKSGRYFIPIGTFGYHWFRVGGVNYSARNLIAL